MHRQKTRCIHRHIHIVCGRIRIPIASGNEIRIKLVSAVVEKIAQK